MCLLSIQEAQSLLSQAWCTLQPQPQEGAGRGVRVSCLAPVNIRKQGTVLTANEFCLLFIVGIPINQGYCYLYHCLAVYGGQFSDQGYSLAGEPSLSMPRTQGASPQTAETNKNNDCTCLRILSYFPFHQPCDKS